MIRSSMKRNLLYGLGLSMLLLLISSIASYVSIKNLIQSSEMVRHSNAVIDNLNKVLSVVKDAETGQRGYLLTGNPIFLEPYDNAVGKTAGLINEISSQTRENSSQQKNLVQLRIDVEQRMNSLARNIATQRLNGKVTINDLLASKKTMDNIRALIRSMQNEEQRLLENRSSELNRLAAFTPSLIIFAALLAIAITLFFYKKVSSDFDEKLILQDELQKKNDETENRIIAIENVASRISDGDYKMRLDEKTKDGLGSLSGSLNRMAISLHHSFNLLREKEWLQSGIALLNDTMVGEKAIHTLAHDILENIVERTESQVAAIYILEEDNLLHLVGSYALEKEKKNVLQIGEGISGQCFQSGKEILIKNISHDDVTISFATGKIKPRSVIAVPLTIDRRSIGVLELASIEEFTDLQMEFLKGIAGNIGIAFYGAMNRKRLQELLEQTQAQAEELQSQHSELESINAELEAQTQKVLASEEELRVQQEELLQSNQELEERTSLLEEKNKLIEERNYDIEEKSKQLEQSTKYKSEFLANMSHELRTPLNSILLLSKLMSESTDIDKQYVEYADVMYNSGQGLLSLIDEILDLSKIEAGKMTLEISEVSAQEVITDMNALFAPLAKNKKLELKINSRENTDWTFQTDKMRLEQILKNLLSNAMKFTSEGYVQLEVTNDVSAKNVVFKVCDTGIGIAKDKQDLVFEAFQQADGSTRRKFGGTGLGLSISRELARLLKGEIELKSTEGVGSEFTLTLPIDIRSVVDETELAEEQKDKPTFPTEKKEEAPKRFITHYIPQTIEDDRDNIIKGDKVILIVEDDTDFAKILVDFSRKKNYKTIVAVSGDAGIELANHFKPLAILLDIQLPVMDGWQVMEALKSNIETRHIPVHIMSSFKLKRESLLKGAVDFIDKPFVAEQLQDVFKKLEEAPNQSPKKVLIVEENKQHAKALSFFLSTNNINTEIINNMSESIDALNKDKIDCVILHLGLPDKNAYETLETIKQSKGLENLPIIVFTGKNLSKGEENSIKKYADSIVVKTAYSYQRILDEAALFLHLVEEKNKKGNEKNQAFENIRELRNILKDKTVLVADDDVRNIFSLTKALELNNMKVLSATDGREALKALKENPQVDVILMDMMMPEMDGYETIREIRSIQKYKRLPILAVTAKAMIGDREKCIAVGASDYISKPVDTDQLISLLRVWLYDKI